MIRILELIGRISSEIRQFFDMRGLMQHWNKRFATLALCLSVFLTVLAAPALANKAGDRVAAQVTKAMEEYDMMEFEKARALLTKTIAWGEKNGAEPASLARAYVNLGIVYFSGLSKSAKAKEAFSKAVELDSAVEIDIAYRTDELTTLLGELKPEEGEGTGGCEIAGLEHTLVDEVGRNQAATLKAKVGDAVNAKRVMLFYRSEGQLEFDSVTMKKGPGCQYTGRIPSRAVTGDFVHYYIAALDEGGKELERKGSSGSPNIIEITAAGGSSSGATDFDDDEDPLNAHRKDGLLSDDSKGLFLSIGVGTGTGYVNGPTEKTKSELKENHFAAAYLHLAPEVGYFLSEQLALSVALRMGLPIGANVEGHATLAPAGLLRVRYALNPNGEGLGVSGSLGGGIIRNVVPIENAPSGMDTDTTAMGPLLFGAGVGYKKSLSKTMHLVGELGALAAVTAGFKELGSCPGDGCVRPKNGVQIDANLAMLFAF